MIFVATWSHPHKEWKEDAWRRYLHPTPRGFPRGFWSHPWASQLELGGSSLYKEPPCYPIDWSQPSFTFSDVKDVCISFVNELTLSVICTTKIHGILGHMSDQMLGPLFFRAGGGSGQHTSEIARKVPGSRPTKVEWRAWSSILVSLKNGWIFLLSSTTSMNLRYTMRKNTVDSLNWSFMVSACFNHALCAPLQHYHIYQGYKLSCKTWTVNSVANDPNAATEMDLLTGMGIRQRLSPISM